jgi:hypothetical protein
MESITFETLSAWLLPLGILIAAFVGAPVWLDIAERAGRRRVLGGTSLAVGMALSAWTVSALPAVAQTSDAAPEAAAPADSVSSSSSGPEQLDVPIQSEAEAAAEAVVVPEDRPAWVESAPVLEGEVHRVSVNSDFQAREADAWRALDGALVKSTRAYVADYLGSNKAPLFFSFSLDEIKTQYLRPENVYHEVVQVSFGPMHQAHALLEFPPEFRRHLDERWSQVRAAGNLVTVGGSVIGVLALLAIVFGYFRLDTATRGYYTSRLQFLAAVAILALIVAAFMFARTTTVWVQWMLL